MNPPAAPAPTMRNRNGFSCSPLSMLALCVLAFYVLAFCVDTAESSFPGRWPAASGVPGLQGLPQLVGPA